MNPKRFLFLYSRLEHASCEFARALEYLPPRTYSANFNRREITFLPPFTGVWEFGVLDSWHPVDRYRGREYSEITVDELVPHSIAIEVVRLSLR